MLEKFVPFKGGNLHVAYQLVQERADKLKLEAYPVYSIGNLLGWVLTPPST